jgi:phage terminase large subunit GpA-like protein
LDCFVYALAALALARLKIDDCELQRTEAKNVGSQPEKTAEPISWGAQPGSSLELASWGVSSQVVPERDTRGRRAWGVQPNSGLGDF